MVCTRERPIPQYSIRFYDWVWYAAERRMCVCVSQYSDGADHRSPVCTSHAQHSSDMWIMQLTV